MVKRFKKMMMSVLILLSLMTASLSVNALSERLLFSSPDIYTGCVQLTCPDNYQYYIFVVSGFNVVVVLVRASTLEQNNE